MSKDKISCSNCGQPFHGLSKCVFPPTPDVTIGQALENALKFLEEEGYTSGDIYADLALVVNRLKTKHRAAAEEVL